MIAASAGAIRRPGAYNFPAPVVLTLKGPSRSSANALGPRPRRTTISPLKVASGACALLATALAVTMYWGEPETFDLASPRSETIVFRQEQESDTTSARTEAFEHQQDEDAAVPSNYPRLVRTLRFVLDPSQYLASRSERSSKSKPNDRRQIATNNFAYRAEGLASWYGPDFHGGRTANGERYDMNGISAAHRSMPLPSYARVTNLDNGRSIIVRVNNRGPYIHNRIVDLSVGTAKALDFYKKGTTRVRVEFVGRAPVEGSDDQMLLATLRTGTPAPAPTNVMVASAKPFPAKGGDGRQPSLPTEH